MDDFDVPEDLRALSRNADRTWRDEMAIRESEAELARAKERGLPDILWESMQRGDEVTVHAAGRSVRGGLQAVRNDFALLDAGSGPVGINLRTIDAVTCVRVAGATGTAGDRTYGSLYAYLSHLEADHRRVRVIARGSRTDVTGRLLALADDHVLLGDDAGAEWAVRLTSLVFVSDLSRT